MVQRQDDLKSLSAQHDGIIFDDMNFKTWAVEDALCLLDWDEPRSVPARYSDASIRADVPLIFTTNKKPKNIFPRSRNARQRRALARRYSSYQVMGPLQSVGRPFTAAEKDARKKAGLNGPKGPGAP